MILAKKNHKREKFDILDSYGFIIQFKFKNLTIPKVKQF